MSQSGSKVFAWQLCRSESDPQKPEKKLSIDVDICNPSSRTLQTAGLYVKFTVSQLSLLGELQARVPVKDKRG